MRHILREIRRNLQRLRERPQRVAERHQREETHRRLFDRFSCSPGLVVRSGPFAGMRYLAEASWIGYFPRLLGIYEEELHDVVERAIEAEPERVIDIGSAEGYYAVGLARRLPAARVYAFDIDANARRLCAEMAERNDASDRVSIRGVCSRDDLGALVVPRTLVVSDCEGAELRLLDPERVPALRRAVILVELHDTGAGDAAATMRRRFGTSHAITVISSTERDPARYPELQALSVQEKEFAVDEFRGGTMEWLYMEPRGTWPRDR